MRTGTSAALATLALIAACDTGRLGDGGGTSEPATLDRHEA